MEQKERISAVKLLITIVDRGKGKKVASVFGKYGLHFHMVSFGKGTASSETLDYLGLGETDKSLVMSLSPEEKVPDVRAALVEDMKLYSPGKGIFIWNSHIEHQRTYGAPALGAGLSIGKGSGSDGNDAVQPGACHGEPGA